MMTAEMRNTPIYWLIFLSAVVLSTFGCRRGESRYSDHPRVAVGTAVRDVIFHSAALNRDMPYRVILPATVTVGRKLPVVYLLHGGGGEFRDWSNYSDVGRISGPGFILIMPEGASSYYTNSVDQPQDRYEDYIVNDLVSDVEKRFPAAPERQNRAIVGVSMGGFGAIK